MVFAAGSFALGARVWVEERNESARVLAGKLNESSATARALQRNGSYVSGTILNTGRRSDSRVLHAHESCLSHPAVALSIVGADVVWVVLSAVACFPSRFEAILQTLVAAVTLAMVLIIQHTQSRRQEVTPHVR